MGFNSGFKGLKNSSLRFVFKGLISAASILRLSLWFYY